MINIRSNHILFGPDGRTKIEYLNFCVVPNFAVYLFSLQIVVLNCGQIKAEEAIKLTLSCLFRMRCNLGRSWVK
jgi:hypothetical protein